MSRRIPHCVKIITQQNGVHKFSIPTRRFFASVDAKMNSSTTNSSSSTTEPPLNTTSQQNKISTSTNPTSPPPGINVKSVTDPGKLILVAENAVKRKIVDANLWEALSAQLNVLINERLKIVENQISTSTESDQIPVSPADYQRLVDGVRLSTRFCELCDDLGFENSDSQIQTLESAAIRIAEASLQSVSTTTKPIPVPAEGLAGALRVFLTVVPPTESGFVKVRKILTDALAKKISENRATPSAVSTYMRAIRENDDMNTCAGTSTDEFIAENILQSESLDFNLTETITILETVLARTKQNSTTSTKNNNTHHALQMFVALQSENLCAEITSASAKNCADLAFLLAKLRAVNEKNSYKVLQVIQERVLVLGADWKDLRYSLLGDDSEKVQNKKYNTAAIVHLTYAFAKFGKNVPADFYDTLTLQARKALHSFSLHELSQLLVSLAKIGHKDDVLFARASNLVKNFDLEELYLLLEQNKTEKDRIAAFQDVLNLFMAFARNQIKDVKLYLEIFSPVLNFFVEKAKYGWNFSESSTSSTSSSTNASTNSSTASTTTNCGVFSPSISDWISVVHAYSKVRVLDEDLFGEIANIITKNIETENGQIISRDCTKWILSCGKLELSRNNLASERNEIIVELIEKHMLDVIRNDDGDGKSGGNIQKMKKLDALRLSQALEKLNVEFYELETKVSELFPNENKKIETDRIVGVNGEKIADLPGPAISSEGGKTEISGINAFNTVSKSGAKNGFTPRHKRFPKQERRVKARKRKWTW